MAEQTLTKLLKAGYPQFKEHGRIPPWLLPQRSFGVVADGFGDTKILDSSRCLDLSVPATDELPDTESFPGNSWREACLEWPQISLVKDMIITLFESIQLITAKYPRSELTIEPQVVCRGLMVMFLAPFVPQGKNVLESIAAIMDANPESPADLIRKYTSVVLTDDRVYIAKVDNCICSHREWAGWTDLMQQQSQDFDGDYKLVAVTPPLSDGLAYALAAMLKEAPHAGA
jgi:hypothetical protein